MTQQYLILPSNTTDFTTNKTGSFRVKLPTALTFDGDWELALSEIQYPVSWNTVKVSEGGIHIIIKHNGYRVLVKFQVQSGYYNDINELVEAINYALSMEGEQVPNILFKADLALYKVAKLKQLHRAEFIAWKQLGYGYHNIFKNPELIPGTMDLEEGSSEALHRLHKNVVISDRNRHKSSGANLLVAGFKVIYNPRNKRVELELTEDYISRIYFDAALQFMLGFDKDRELIARHITADYNSDISAGLGSFYIYCNLIEPQFVGNSLEPLLRTVPLTENKLGAIVHKEFLAPHYIALLAKSFDTVEVNIRDDHGQLLDFQFGKVIIKLHLRKKPLLNL